MFLCLLKALYSKALYSKPYTAKPYTASLIQQALYSKAFKGTDYKASLLRWCLVIALLAEPVHTTGAALSYELNYDHFGIVA